MTTPLTLNLNDMSIKQLFDLIKTMNEHVNELEQQQQNLRKELEEKQQISRNALNLIASKCDTPETADLLRIAHDALQDCDL